MAKIRTVRNSGGSDFPEIPSPVFQTALLG
jgi:hypothetical protein